MLRGIALQKHANQYLSTRAAARTQTALRKSWRELHSEKIGENCAQKKLEAKRLKVKTTLRVRDDNDDEQCEARCIFRSNMHPFDSTLRMTVWLREIILAWAFQYPSKPTAGTEKLLHF